jgi:hypothetical protein
MPGWRGVYDNALCAAISQLQNAQGCHHFVDTGQRQVQKTLRVGSVQVRAAFRNFNQCGPQCSEPDIGK